MSLFRDYDDGLPRYRPPAPKASDIGRPKPQQDAAAPRETAKRHRLRWGPRLVWTNPNPPAKRADPKQRKS